MIKRVWGRVNGHDLDFTPVKDRPGYWEGIAPRARHFQEIEIWAENHQGARGHLECAIIIHEWTPTEVHLLLAPYKVRLLPLQYDIRLLPPQYKVRRIL